jgi:hypothetical protein
MAFSVAHVASNLRCELEELMRIYILSVAFILFPVVAQAKPPLKEFRLRDRYVRHDNYR